MNAHHKAWLDGHPNRAAGWLKDRLAEGFVVHHLDGVHHNNDPSNLVLIDGDDHNRLHGSTGEVLRVVGPVRYKRHAIAPWASAGDIVKAFHMVVAGRWPS